MGLTKLQADAETMAKHKSLGYADDPFNRRQGERVEPRLDFRNGVYEIMMVEIGKDWETLLQNVKGAKCLPEILKRDLVHMVGKTYFLGDPACEWTYFMDLVSRACYNIPNVLRGLLYAEW